MWYTNHRMHYMPNTLKKSVSAWLRRPTTASMLVTFVLSFALVTARQFFISRDMMFFGTRFVDYIDIIPVLIFASLNGPIAASVLAFCIFAVASAVMGVFSFEVSVFMIAAIIAYRPVSRGWYKTKKGTCVAVVRFVLILGVLWNFLFAFVTESPLTLLSAVAFAVMALPVGVVTGLFCYLFFNHASVRVRRLFLCGSFYLDDGDAASRSSWYLGGEARIQRKIELNVLAMAVLLVVGAIFMTNMIMHNMGKQLSDMGNHLHDIADELFFQLRGFPQRWSANLDFCLRLKDFVITDVRLVLLLLNAVVPVVLVANYFAQKYIALPVVRMSRAVDDFTHAMMNRDKDSLRDAEIHRLAIDTDDEIQDLYQAIKKTAVEMIGYAEFLEREQQLKDDLRIAREANKAKSAFLSNMSHEIRTPINAVLGFDEMILREATDPVIIDYANDIRNSGKTLLGLINDILDFSKIEAGKMEIIPVQYELSSTINDLVNMIRKKAEDKHLALTVNIDKTIPHLLFGDEVRIKQCVLNILTNAVKYTHKGSVTLNVAGTRKSDDTIDLSVQVIDTGIGIKQEDVQKLFTAFERIEEERNRTIEGTGLGMNIVQQLLAMMGSSLVVRSEYGKGSDFSFVVEQKVMSWNPIGDVTQMYRTSLAAEAAYRESFTAPDAHILVTDDTPLNLKVVQGLLKQTRIQIDTAESGCALLNLAQNTRYDVIFIDHRMPDLDGVETLHALQQLAGSKNGGVPCIALTANAVSGAREYYLGEGFTDYLSKPIDAAKLEKLLQKYLPAEKVHVTPGDRAEPADSDRRDDTPDADGFPAMEGIDLAEALKNCGDADILREAFKDFSASIAEKSAQIAGFAAAQDWKNYTVLVHALKSSARLIGALGLSADAKYLEACGDRGDAAEIEAKTPALLELYRSYQTILLPVTGVPADRAEKTPITQQVWDEAVAALREVVGTFDFTMADAIVEQIDGYQLSEPYAARWKAIKTAVANVDQAAVMQALDGK